MKRCSALTCLYYISCSIFVGALVGWAAAESQEYAVPASRAIGGFQMPCEAHPAGHVVATCVHLGKGKILTAYHVASKVGETLPVVFGGQTYDAICIRSDVKIHLSELQIRSPLFRAPVLVLAARMPHIGDAVHAVGNQHGIPKTFVRGLLSARDYPAELESGIVITDVYQIPLGPGSSGTPILNEHGRIIGLDIAGPEDKALVFAVRLQDLRAFLEAGDDG